MALQSWVIYIISTGTIICYGRNIDVVADQSKIDIGDTSCTLYMIQQLLSANPEYGCIYADCNCVDPLGSQLKEVDHALQELVDMPLYDIKIEIKRLANKDIVSNFQAMSNLKTCIERIQGSIPDEAAIQSNIDDWMDGLEGTKATIDSQIADLATSTAALQYYGSRAWLAEFPGPVEWEEM